MSVLDPNLTFGLLLKSFLNHPNRMKFGVGPILAQRRRLQPLENAANIEKTLNYNSEDGFRLEVARQNAI